MFARSSTSSASTTSRRKFRSIAPGKIDWSMKRKKDVKVEALDYNKIPKNWRTILKKHQLQEKALFILTQRKSKTTFALPINQSKSQRNPKSSKSIV